MNRSVFILFILAGTVSACDNSTPIPSALAIANFKEYCELITRGSFESEGDDPENLKCRCGAKKCVNRGCNKEGDDCEEFELCGDEGDVKYKPGEDGDLCYVMTCKDGFYIEEPSPEGNSCRFSEDGKAIGFGDCKNYDHLCKKSNDESKGAKRFECKKGEFEERECAKNFCYNDNCAECEEEMHYYEFKGNKCQKFICSKGSYVVDESFKCPDNVSCTYLENGEVSCGKCLDTSETTCIKGEGDTHAVLQFCANGEQQTIDCPTSECENNNCKFCEHGAEGCVATCNEGETKCIDVDLGAAIMTCENNEYTLKTCLNSCNGNKCGDCLNGKLQCLKGILQYCEGGTWHDANINADKCFQHNDNVYYCKDDTTLEAAICKNCYKNICLEDDQGYIQKKKESDQVVVRRTPKTGGTTGSVNGYPHYVGTLANDTIVNIVGKLNESVYLVKFSKEELNKLAKYKNDKGQEQDVKYFETWTTSKNYYYYVEAKYIITKSKKTIKDTKVYASKIISNDSIKLNDASSQNYVDVDDIERKTRNIAFNDILKAMKKPEFDFKKTAYDKYKSLREYFNELKVPGWEITTYQNTANYCNENLESWRWLRNGESDKFNANSLINSLNNFFTSNDVTKAKYVVARVGCESKEGGNSVFGYWGNYHYITIYGYDPNNTFKYKEGYKYNGKPREKETGFFYVNDHLNSEYVHYGMYGAERVVQQATQLFFFKEK